MTALRWILLLAGLVFLGGLTAWELWRARRSQASASSLPGPTQAADDPFPEAPPPRAPAPPAAALDPPLLDAESLWPAPEGEPPGEAATPIAPDAPSAMTTTGEPSLPTAADGEAPAPLPSAPLLVEWPPEGERYILSVRLVADRAEPLSGRLLRQGLEFCGFQHGRFGIFHQPGLDGRALVSAAGLNKPGIFDPLNMDFQHFSGLSLFAVLPGPLPCGAALDHLLHTARELAQRVHGRLQDEQGAVLDAESIERLKRRLEQLPGGSRPEETAA